jgi:transposase InsO family protein
MDQKIQMISDHITGNYCPTELSRIYGVSRKTVYKWINRYTQDPQQGLTDRCRAPYTRPNAVPDPVKQTIIKTKLKYPHLGPKKIMHYLRRQFPNQYWPVHSTAGVILARAGLVRRRRRKARVAPNALPFASCEAPNSVWSADYKGDFKLGDRSRCYPLTVSDNYSRYLFACQGLPNTRYEHGSPFASTAFGGLSRLSAWWVRLGIRPERIEKGKPNQNGRHERMHRSLKQGAINPARYSIKAQQKAFEKYRQEYNNIRSHESLKNQVPADVYRLSNRPMPSKLAGIAYAPEFKVRKVRHKGDIKWQGKKFYLSQILAKQAIGFKQTSENRWSIYYSFYLLGYWNQRKQKLDPVRPINRNCPPPPVALTLTRSCDWETELY